MKNLAKFLLIVLALLTAAAVFSSCNKDSTDDSDPAVSEVKKLLEAYYTDINDKDFDNIGQYFGSGVTDVQERIDSFKFMSTIFEVKYELGDVIALYLEDGNISASAVTKITSKNISTDTTTVVSEHSTYIIGKENDKMVIISMDIGDSQVVDSAN